MNKVFISYRHVQPDDKIARFLGSFLQERGLEVFIDNQISVGTKWIDEIEQRLLSSNFFIVLLSTEAIRSDFIRQEVKMAYELSRSSKGGFAIFPVRIGFMGELPYDLSAYLGPIQFAVLEADDDYEIVCKQLITAIENQKTSRGLDTSETEENFSREITELVKTTEEIGAPLPSADHRIFVETGTVKLNSPFYISRDADNKLDTQMCGDGTTTIIKGCRQIGKSSLLARAYASALNNKQRVFYVDFQLIDDSQMVTLESLLHHLARKLAKCFNSADVDELWDSHLGPKENLTDYIEDAVLSSAETQCVILLDEVDLIFNQNYRDQFFSTIRVWHNLRAIKEIWNRLNIVIAHSTEPYLWIQDVNQSPFNVGYQIKLSDFDLNQVLELSVKYNSVLKSVDEVRTLMSLVGGHPYLVRQALFSLTHFGLSLQQLNKIATDGGGPFDDHLKRYIWILQKNDDLKRTLLDVLEKGECENELDFQRITAAGLVTGETRHSVQLRCRIYEEYFKKHL